MDSLDSNCGGLSRRTRGAGTDHASQAPDEKPTKEFAKQNRLLSSAPAFVRGWAECRNALSGPELVSDPCLAGVAHEPANNLLLLDGDMHRTVRRLVMPYLTRPLLNWVEEELEETCDALVRSLPGKSDIDLIADLVEPLVLAGIMSAMEIPDDRRQKLCEFARGMLGMLEPKLPPDARRLTRMAALGAMGVFCRDAAAGEAVGLHATLEAAAKDGLIPVNLARSTPVVVLHGGYENPLNQLGCVISWAAANPAEFYAAAEADPALVFEEIVRMFSPVRRVARWVKSDGEFGDPPLNRGDFVWVDLESANHDDGQFRADSQLDVSLRRRHLGFGHGPHACPGSTLARLQGWVLIKSLLALPHESFREFSTEWRDGFVARGPMRIARR
jgi:cytochrome P450